MNIDIEHKMAMEAVGFAFQLLEPNAKRLKALVDAERSMHSFLHITDPTLYIKASRDKGLKQQVELAKAALAFLATVQSVRDQNAEDA